jgi:signal transduction histidine kinase/uncharacterized protein YigA (DUF484 family)
MTDWLGINHLQVDSMESPNRLQSADQDRTASGRIALLLVISGSVGAVAFLPAIVSSPGWLPSARWLASAAPAFSIGAALSIALLSFGRFLFRQDRYAVWVGLAFWLSFLLQFFYLLALHGAVPATDSAAAHLFYLVYLALFSPAFFCLSGGGHPVSPAWGTLWKMLGWASLACLAAIAAILWWGAQLPALSLVDRTTLLSRLAPYALLLLNLGAVGIHWKHYRTSRNPLAGYFVAFLVISFWVSSAVIQSEREFDLAWFFYHLLPTFGYLLFYIGLLLEYLDLYHALDTTLARMVVTQQLSTWVSGSLSLEEICRRLSEELRKLVPYDRLAVNLLQKDRQYVKVYSEESGLPALAVPEGYSPREGTATGWVIDSKQPLICGDLAGEQRFSLTHRRYKNIGLRSYIILPLIAKGQILGALNLGSLKPNEYSGKHIAILVPVAEILSVAIENADLYREAQSRERIQKLFNELSQDITSMDLDALLRKLTDKVRETLNVDLSDVRVVEKGQWNLKGISGVSAERVRSEGGAVVGRSTWIIEHRRPLMIPDSTLENTIPMGKTVTRLGLRGYLGVPLFSRGGEVIGILRALTFQPRDFTQEEVDLLQQLGNGAAVALENARLFEEVQRKSAELEEAFNAKSEFLNTMAHELRTPLSVVIGTGDLLLDGFFGEVKEEQRKALDRISRHSQDLLNLINEILDLVRLESRKIPIYAEEFSAREIAGDLEGSFGPLAQDKGIKLRVTLQEGLPVLKSDRSKIREILQNLLANAVKYTDRGEIAVSVSLQPGDGTKTDRILWSVRDSGIGIREADLPRLFEPFYLGEGMDRKKYPGTGLGLSIVERLVELLNGEIRVQSEWGKGSTFTVAIPVTRTGDS